ncbi:MAG TPA: hypothetical protein VLN49_15145 [Gemmatimonadaceae bacterium]|nr:hypothetical protein [Gemmatimonadaceae bacterium]
MRTITDSGGIEWTVFEVRRPPEDRSRWTYLPEEYGDGWLCFESVVGKRRLTPIPARWRDMSDHTLLLKMREAQPVLRRVASEGAAPDIET